MTPQPKEGRAIKILFVPSTKGDEAGLVGPDNLGLDAGDPPVYVCRACGVLPDPYPGSYGGACPHCAASLSVRYGSCDRCGLSPCHPECDGGERVTPVMPQAGEENRGSRVS
jgi:hypothetical protein